MNIAKSLAIKMALRPSLCPVVLTIKAVDLVTKHTDDGPIAVHQLTGLSPDGITYTVNLNQVTASQLIEITRSPETDHWTGKRVLATTSTKGDRTYLQFTDAPLAAPSTPKALPAGPNKQLPEPLTKAKDAATNKPERLTDEQQAKLAKLARCEEDKSLAKVGQK